MRWVIQYLLFNFWDVTSIFCSPVDKVYEKLPNVLDAKYYNNHIRNIIRAYQLREQYLK